MNPPEQLNNKGISKDQVDIYLRNLRDSGATNMWGAAPYLKIKFGFDNKEASDELVRWIKEFK